MKEKKI